MEGTPGILRSRAESGTSLIVSYHQYCADFHSVENRDCKITVTHPDEDHWENLPRYFGWHYNVQTFGGVIYLVIVNLPVPTPAPAQSTSLADRFRKVVSMLRVSALTHASSAEVALQPCLKPAVQVPSEKLTAAITKYRNWTTDGFSIQGFGKLEDRVESTMFLSTLSRLARTKQERLAARCVYSRFYDLRMAEDYLLCDRILGDADVDRLTPVVLLALLTITAPVKKNLGNRSAFYDRVRKAVGSLRGPDATNTMLIGLE